MKEQATMKHPESNALARRQQAARRIGGRLEGERLGRRIARGGGQIVGAVRAAVEREAGEQRQHFQTQDFREGVAAMAQRRDPVFGRH